MTILHPKKLLLTKWTAVHPFDRQKHFLVTKVIVPDNAKAPVEWVDIESVFGQAGQRINWRALRDETQWRQGWV